MLPKDAIVENENEVKFLHYNTNWRKVIWSVKSFRVKARSFFATTVRYCPIDIIEKVEEIFEYSIIEAVSLLKQSFYKNGK